MVGWLVEFWCTSSTDLAFNRFWLLIDKECLLGFSIASRIACNFKKNRFSQMFSFTLNMLNLTKSFVFQINVPYI